MQMHFSNDAKLYCDIVDFWKDISLFLAHFQAHNEEQRRRIWTVFRLHRNKGFLVIMSAFCENIHIWSWARGVWLTHDT